MTKLSTARRKALPASDFAGPGRSFPVEDANHARAALRDAPHAYHAGSISLAEEKRIVARAKRVLGK